MTAATRQIWDNLAIPRVQSGPRLRDTNFGFAVEERKESDKNKDLVEAALKAVALIMLAGSAVIALQGTGFESAKPLVQLGFASGFFSTGFALFIYASRGFRNELRIDAGRRELSIGTVNARGSFHSRKTIKASKIQSFFLVRSKNKAPAILCARAARGKSVIRIMSGKERDLVPVLEKISETFQPPSARKVRVRTRATEAFIHAR